MNESTPLLPKKIKHKWKLHHIFIAPLCLLIWCFVVLCMFVYAKHWNNGIKFNIKMRSSNVDSNDVIIRYVKYQVTRIQNVDNDNNAQDWTERNVCIARNRDYIDAAADDGTFSSHLFFKFIDCNDDSKNDITVWKEIVYNDKIGNAEIRQNDNNGIEKCLSLDWRSYNMDVETRCKETSFNDVFIGHFDCEYQDGKATQFMFNTESNQIQYYGCHVTNYCVSYNSDGRGIIKHCMRDLEHNQFGSNVLNRIIVS